MQFVITPDNVEEFYRRFTAYTRAMAHLHDSMQDEFGVLARARLYNDYVTAEDRALKVQVQRNVADGAFVANELHNKMHEMQVVQTVQRNIFDPLLAGGDRSHKIH